GEGPASPGRQARSPQLQLAWGLMRVWPPRWAPHAPPEPLERWVMRVWEEEPPEGEAPLEWLRRPWGLTAPREQAWARVAWCPGRWVGEGEQPGLNSGCPSEDRHLPRGARWIRVLGVRSPGAARAGAPARAGASRARAPRLRGGGSR